MYNLFVSLFTPYKSFLCLWVQLQQHLKDEESELVSILGQLKEKLQSTFKVLVHFQSRNSEYVFNTGWCLNSRFSCLLRSV